MNTREEFEKSFSIPDIIRWSESIQRYVSTTDGRLSTIADRYNDRLRIWNAAQEAMAVKLGICTECGEIPVMHTEGPFSSCACGTGEDYARRPLQKMQMIERTRR